MKKILLTALLPLAVAAHAAPDAKLTADNALLQELQKNHADIYNTLEGKTLAELTPAINRYLLTKLATSSDATFAAYADAFVNDLERLGKHNAKVCHAVLTSQQTPSLLDLEQRLGVSQKKLHPALAALLNDKGGWTPPESDYRKAMAEVMDNVQKELENNGEKSGLAYTLGGQTPSTPEQFLLACQGGTAFFKDLNQPKDANKITVLRYFLAQ